jgi:hypothetical protein
MGLLIGSTVFTVHSFSFRKYWFSKLFLSFSARTRSFLFWKWSFLQHRNFAYTWVFFLIFSQRNLHRFCIYFPMISSLIRLFEWICSYIECEFRFLFTPNFVQIWFPWFFDLFSYLCDSNFRLQLISSAYQRCRLSDQICRLAVGLTRSSSSDPSLRISSKPLSSLAD